MSVPSLTTSPPLLVGRERELGVLRQHLDAAMQGHGSLVLIGGEAGIGKTTLAEAICHEAAARGALMLVGRCYDLMETPPYGPWVELFGRYRAADDLPALPAAFAGRGTVGPVSSLMALSQEACDFLATVSSQLPLVLLLEDLHWADPASLDLLRFVARVLDSLPVLVIETYRADEITDRHPLAQLLPALVREANAARLVLGPLGTENVRALVEARYPLPPGDAARLTTHLDRRAEGNPFFLGELLRSLEEERALRQGASGWMLGDLGRAQVPPLLRQVIAGRLARLGDAVYASLMVAAVIGQDIPPALWGEASGADEETLIAAAERAIEAHILDAAGDGLRFTHALIREALYEGISPPRRRLLHRRVGELLAARTQSDADRVAYHFQQAGDPRALTWLVAAAEHAQRSYAWLTAADRLAAALAIEADDESPAQRGWLRYRLGMLRRFADPPASVVDLAESEQLAVDAGDRLLAAYATFFRGHCLCNTGEIGAGVREMEAGVAALDTLSKADRRRMQELTTAGVLTDLHNHRGILAYWLVQVGDLARGRNLAEMVVARQRDLRSTGGLGDAYATAHFGLAGACAALGQVAEARRAYMRAREAYGPIGHHYMIGLATEQELNVVVLPYLADDHAEREAVAVAAEGSLARSSGAMAAQSPRIARLLLMLVDGEWDEARELATAGLATGIDFVAQRALAVLAYERGDANAAWAMVRALLPSGAATEPGTTFLATTLVLQRIAAALRCDAGDVAAARAWLGAHDRLLEWSGSVLGRAEGDLAWARLELASGNLSAARERAMRALAAAAQPRQPLVLLAAHRLVAEIATASGHPDEAAAHLAAALDLADACAAPYERALTRLAQAEWCIATDALVEAADATAEARTICTPLRAARALAWADRLEAALARHACTAHTSHHAPRPDGLTRRELDILRLIAAGASNREIADQLSISVRTVERHITNLYRKIEARGKADATAYLFRHRLD